MFETYKLMQKVNTTLLKEKTLEEVVFLFQTTADGRVKNKCFAYIFCELFPMLLKIHKKYNNFSHEQKTEEIIGCLERSANKYKPQTKAKFSTFVYGNTIRHLINVYAASNRNKNKVWLNIQHTTDNINPLSKVKYVDNNLRYNMFVNDLKTIMEPEELSLCKLLMAGYKNKKDLYNASYKMLSESQAYSKINKLKQNIKKKIQQNKELFI